jgi:anti-sigma B factor antagonist
MALTLAIAQHQARSAEAALLRAGGAIEQSTAPELDRALAALEHEGKLFIAIDCSEVRYVASSGFAVLVKHAQALAEQGGGLALLGVNRKVGIVVDMLGIEDTFATVCERVPVLY